ncbi:MAG: DUF4183 domain-containing protein [Christensenellales bacterium]
MALQLFRLASEPFPSISGATSQLANAYFRAMSSTVPIASGSAYSLEVSTWFTGDGTTATAFATDQGLNLLSINGVLQQPGLYEINSDAVVITPSVGGFTLISGYPITLQTYNANTEITVETSVSSFVAIP